ncbi:hypothetical protein [Aquimarina agarilytica]|uniref:hypothetical protein n=1 Tax=Aquimarina agarilytica TaxID=1087449 RepID=UPI0002892918|nr:hypothetical protein [Aquimarina agarilytica]
MKNLLLILILLGTTITSTAQNPSVEKSLFGVQAGILGIWSNYEAKLTNTIGIRRHIGKHFNYETGIGIGYIDYHKESFVYDDELSIDLHIRLGYSF